MRVPAKAVDNITTLIAASLSLHRDGRTRDALEMAQQGLAIAPNALGLLINNGIFAAALDDPQGAEACYRRATKLDPDCTVAWNNLGNLLASQQRVQEAEAAYRNAIRIRPDYANAHNNLGCLLLKSKRPSEAEAEFRAAVEAHPDSADAYSNLAATLLAMESPSAAEAACRRAIELQTGHFDALSNLGLALTKCKRPAEAESAYRQALAVQPDSSTVLINLAMLLLNGRRLDEADACLTRAAAGDASSQLHCALGNLRWQQRRLAEAEAHFREGLRGDPEDAITWNNLGGVMLESGDDPTAEAAFRRALTLNLDNRDARWNLALLLLRHGRYAEGWPAYEARRAFWPGDQNFAPPPADETHPLPPHWNGESLEGKSLLVWQEQGLGDEIQFVRFLLPLRQLGACTITLVCKQALKPLLVDQGLADRVLGTDEWRPEMAAIHDHWCYLMSLPACLCLDSIPTQPPYLKADTTRIAFWSAKLPSNRPLIGLVWRGSPVHAFDADRSLPSLAVLEPVMAVPGMSFVSLQKGSGEEEAGSWQDPPLAALGSELCDFADSAAIVSQLDLVITVDTAIAHLSGAIGIPCWILLSAAHTDWRWLEDRGDSPWYPGLVRLFRQDSPGDWSGAVCRLAAALQARYLTESN